MNPKTLLNLLVSTTSTVLSRLIGFFRSLAELSFLGLGETADAYQSAFRLANFFRELFGEGALASVLNPGYEKARAETDDQGARAFFSLCALGTATVSSLLCLALYLALPTVLPAWLWDMPQGALKQTEELATIMLPFLPLIALASVAMIWLQIQGKFFLSSVHPVLFSVAIILLGLWNPLDSAAHSLALGVLVGGALQCAILWWYADLSLPSPSELRTQVPRLKALVLPMIPVLLALVCARAGKLVEVQFASRLVSGGIAGLTYATVVLYVPLGLISIAVSNVLFPLLSRQYAFLQKEAFDQTFRTGVLLLTAVSAPVSVLLWFHATELSTLLFHSIPRYIGVSAIGVAEATRIGECLQGYAPSVVFLCQTPFLIRTFHAVRNTKAPAVLSALLLVCNFIFNDLLVDTYQHFGIALAASLVAMMQTLSLLLLLHMLVTDMRSFFWRWLLFMGLYPLLHLICTPLCSLPIAPLIYIVTLFRLKSCFYVKPE